MVNGKLSRSFKRTNGSPQGAVLTPEKYNCYKHISLTRIESLPIGIRMGSIFIKGTAFADDQNHFGKNVKEIQMILDMVAESSAKDGSRYKPEKAKIIALGGQKEWEQAKWRMGSIEVQQVKELTHLGRHIHFRQIARSAHQMDITMKRARKAIKILE